MSFSFLLCISSQSRFSESICLKLSENSFEAGISSVSDKVAFDVLLESSTAKNKNATDPSNDCVTCMCDHMLATGGCYAVLVSPSETYTKTKDNSSYKIQFYCQNSAHKTLK